MMKKLNLISISLIFLLTACGGWTDARKQKILDKCENDVFDCDCFLNNTIESFPDPNEYNNIMENEKDNMEKVDLYWDGPYEKCLK